MAVGSKATNKEIEGRNKEGEKLSGTDSCTEWVRREKEPAQIDSSQRMYSAPKYTDLTNYLETFLFTI